MLARQAHSIDIHRIRNTTAHSFFHVLLTLTALGVDENRPNAGRNLAAPLRHIKQTAHQPAFLFFRRRIAKRPHCFKFLAKFLLKCGLCRWPMCYHVFNWFFLPRPGFSEFIWIFSGRNHLQINMSHTSNPNLTK